MNYRRFGRLGWQVSEIGYGMWEWAVGPARTMPSQSVHCSGPWTWAVISSIRPGRMARVTAKDYWDNSSGLTEEEALHCHKNSAQESSFGPAGVNSHSMIVSTGLYRGVRPQESGERRAAIFRPDPVPYVGRTVGLIDDRLGEEDRRTAPPGAYPRLWASASIAGNRGTGYAQCAAEMIDAVQVIYNIFDQNPEDLSSSLPLRREGTFCRHCARSFDEGSLTGMLTKDSKWPKGDWRKYILCSGETHGQRRARRPAQAASSSRHDNDGDGASLLFSTTRL